MCAIQHLARHLALFFSQLDVFEKFTILNVIRLEPVCVLIPGADFCVPGVPCFIDIDQAVF